MVEPCVAKPQTEEDFAAGLSSFQQDTAIYSEEFGWFALTVSHLYLKHLITPVFVYLGIDLALRLKYSMRCGL